VNISETILVASSGTIPTPINKDSAMTYWKSFHQDHNLYNIVVLSYKEPREGSFDHSQSNFMKPYPFYPHKRNKDKIYNRPEQTSMNGMTNHSSQYRKDKIQQTTTTTSTIRTHMFLQRKGVGFPTPF
jgi:hypothetical protein